MTIRVGWCLKIVLLSLPATDHAHNLELRQHEPRMTFPRVFQALTLSGLLGQRLLAQPLALSRYVYISIRRGCDTLGPLGPKKTGITRTAGESNTIRTGPMACEATCSTSRIYRPCLPSRCEGIDLRPFIRSGPDHGLLHPSQRVSFFSYKKKTETPRRLSLRKCSGLLGKDFRMTTTFHPVTLELIDEGQLLPSLQLDFDDLQDQFMRYCQEHGPKADKAVAVLTLKIKIGCQAGDRPKDNRYAIQAEIDKKMPKRPPTLTYALPAETQDGKTALHCQATGTNGGNPAQKLLNTLPENEPADLNEPGEET